MYGVNSNSYYYFICDNCGKQFQKYRYDASFVTRERFINASLNKGWIINTVNTRDPGISDANDFCGIRCRDKFQKKYYNDKPTIDDLRKIEEEEI
ncbi:hypothetical protein AGMMS50268_41240 [Spirochaetia bacterium]|nr:hypothetical protein AGMMS50268_41240 [Spirochaetia bacterium]